MDYWVYIQYLERYYTSFGCICDHSGIFTNNQPFIQMQFVQ